MIDWDEWRDVDGREKWVTLRPWDEERRGGITPMPETHGTIREYQRGCRCPACRGVWSAYMKEHRPKRQGRRARVPLTFGKMKARMDQAKQMAKEAGL